MASILEVSEAERRSRSILLAIIGVCLSVFVFLAGAFYGRSTGQSVKLHDMMAVQGHSAELSSAGGQWESACGGMFDVQHPIVKFGEDQLCRAYRNVCFDQQQLVSYDPAHSPANATSEPIPKLEVEAVEYAWPGAPENGDRFHNGLSRFTPLTFRPASVLEPSPDMRQPVFSNCTTPVIMWSMWTHNYEEVISHLVSRVWGMQDAGAMSNNSLLVVGTPGGLEPRPFMKFLLQPFSPHPVMTLAELSMRSPPPGHPGRCFAAAYLCVFRDAGYFPGMYHTMQAVHAHYEPTLPPPEAQFDAGEEVLKVLIEHRSGPIRNILNWQQLVDECNALPPEQWGLDPESPIKRVQCRAATFGDDIKANLAAVRPADALVVVHGSGCVNWLAMRRGSAMLEVRPFEFGSKVRGWADWFYPQIDGAIEQAVHWYALNVEDEAASKPSQREADQVNPDPDRYKRDRHTILPFNALREMLARIAAAGRDRERYRQQMEQRHHYVELHPGGELKPVQ